MGKCRWSQRVERWFDGESREPESVAQHVAGCPQCAAMAARLQRFREGVHAVNVRAEIASGQFPAFLEGIRQGIEAPRRRHTGVWALASVSAAALIVAVSLFAMFTGGPEPVEARHTVVESASTEVEGATVETQDSTGKNRAIIWVHRPQKDVL